MSFDLNEGLPASPELYSGEARGELLEVGAGKAYATIDLALDYISTKTWASSTTLVGDVTTTQGSVSFTGTGLSSVSADDYLLVNTKYLAVKSIESDIAGTLWHGAQDNNAAQSADIYSLDSFTIKIFDEQTSTAKTLPVGVDVLIVGNYSNIKLNISASLTISNYFKFEISNIVINLDTAFGVSGAFGMGRGIVHAHDIRTLTTDNEHALFVIHVASFTQSNVTGGRRNNIGADYINVSNCDNFTNTVSDHFLVAQVLTTDSGHTFEFNNYHQLSHGEVTIGQSSGIEFNSVPVGKVLNITNSELVALGSIADAEVIYRGANGTINITDSILDNLNSTFEVRLGAATVNIVNSTRLDGSAIRVEV